MGFALEFADHKHSALGQTYGDKPYTFHLKQVMGYVRKGLRKKYIPEFRHSPYSRDSYSLIKDILFDAALLHDVIEDTDVSYESLLVFFPTEVAAIVKHVSDDDSDGLSRKEKKRLLHEKLSKFDVSIFEEWGALIVKTADRLANYKMAVKKKDKKLIKMYYKEHLVFRKAVWRSGIIDSLWLELQEIDDFVSTQYNFQR